MLGALPRRADNRIGLVAVLGSELAMRGHHFAQGVNFFAVTCRMCGNLRGFLPIATGALQVFAYLLTARTGGIKVLLRIALDLWGAATSGGDLITKLSEPVGQLRLIDGRGELLRGEEILWLKGAVLAVLALSDVEDDCVGVELRSGIAIHRTGGVMLELRGYEFSRGLRRMVPANAGHRVILQMLQSSPDTLPVRLADSVVAAHESSYRYRLGSGKGRVPPGAVIHCFDGLSIGVLILIRSPLAYKLLAGHWVLALAEPREIFSRDRTGNAELCREATLPLAGNLPAL
jgi:hypothetical protein